MDSYYDLELKPLAETAERFATKEILGKVVKLESIEKPEFPWDAVRAGGEAGFLCGPLDEDLGGANLTGAYLFDADMMGASLVGATVTQEQLETAAYPGDTATPDDLEYGESSWVIPEKDEPDTPE